MQLAELVKDWPCTVAGNDYRVECTGVTEHSKRVKKGFIFVAKKGSVNDGCAFIQEAINNGAVAVVIDRPLKERFPESIAIIQVPDSALFLSFASAKFAGNPANELTIVAITGTNGKTTVSHFCSQLLERHGISTAIIGTTGVYLNGHALDDELPSLTTFTAEVLHPLLRRCVEENISYVFLEASSSGLEQARLAHCEIDVGVFLNIGEDHYEEHGSKEAYIQAKKRLAILANKLVINEEDEQWRAMVEDIEKPISSFHSKSPADLQQIQLPFLGQHNLLNTQAALQIMRVLGFDLERFLRYCEQLQLPEGRLQKIEESGITCFIDYAHTPDALEATLSALQQHFSHKLITVFGCGGERDVAKRKKMGAVASRYATHLVITSDNPRGEEPNSIIAAIAEGVERQSCQVTMEPERKLAIQKAVVYAQAGDCILVAGKGHEKTQTIGERTIPFSDAEEVHQALQNKK